MTERGGGAVARLAGRRVRLGKFCTLPEGLRPRMEVRESACAEEALINDT